MGRLFHLSNVQTRDPAVEDWLAGLDPELGTLAVHWFGVMRGRGDDVGEVLHDGQATACVDSAAFAYVAAFTAHVNVGFFNGAELPDPDGLLIGSGRFMRHVKLYPHGNVDPQALERLIGAAYDDVKRRLAAEVDA